MTTKKYVYWQDEDMWLGYLEEYSDYWTQAETENELKDNLTDICKTDIYKELSSVHSISSVVTLKEASYN